MNKQGAKISMEEKLSTEWLLNWLKLTQQGEVEWGFNAEKSEWRASVNQ